MAVDVLIAKLGPEMDSALLTEWLVEDGAAVAEGQPIATIETDKVSTDLVAPADGVLRRMVAADTECAVSQRVAVIAAGDEEITAGAAEQAAPEAGEAASAVASDAASASAAAPAASVPVADAPAAAPVPPTGRIRASPLARRLAADLAIDLAQLAATHPDRPIRKRQVLEASAAPPPATDGHLPAPPAPRPAPAPDQREKLTPMRRRISQRMQASLQETAQITDFREHDVSDLVAMRKEGSKWARRLGLGLSFTDLFVRAAVLSLEAVPDLNASLDGEDLVRHGDANIGIAVAIPDGLVVPVLHGAQNLTLAEINRRIAALVERARAGTLGLEELAGGTFTITNIGSYGSHTATPILVQGQVGILGTGALLQRPVVRDGEIVVGTTMYTSLTIDHRVVDGKTAGEFQTRLGELLASPEDLL